MRSDPTGRAAVARLRADDGGSAPAGSPLDDGLLSPVSVGVDGAVSDRRVLEAMLDAELALTRAQAVTQPGAADALAAIEAVVLDADLDVREIADAGRGGGNPVIPLVKRLRSLVDAVDDGASAWVHRGATSQDVVDTAMMLVAVRAGTGLLARLDALVDALGALAAAHADSVCVGRTLTQHATPTTFGAKAAVWTRSVMTATDELDEALAAVPAQLGGASGTLASLVVEFGADDTTTLPARFAAELGLATPRAPWHVERRPVTRLGDALVGVLDVLGTLATNVATLARPELGEVVEADGGGSSAMPQKRNPVRSVLIRSAAMRAPGLGAELHRAAALSVDERPDGAWHAEWQPLRELLRVALGATELAVELASGLRVETARMRRNLDDAGPLVVAERVRLELAPVIGRPRIMQLIDDAVAGADLAAILRAEPGLEGIDLDALLDPLGYTGLAPAIARDAATCAAGRRTASTAPTEPTESTEPRSTE